MKTIKLLMFFVAAATMMTMSSCTKEKEDNSLAGTKWQLVNEQDATYHGVKVVYTVTFGQNKEMTFTRNVNGTDFVMKGTYTYKDENKHTNDYKYNYYMVDFNTDEYISDGEKQDITNTTSQMEMGIAESGNGAGRQAIIIFVSSYNRYYCYDYSDPTNLTITHFRNPLAPRPSID